MVCSGRRCALCTQLHSLCDPFVYLMRGACGALLIPSKSPSVQARHARQLDGPGLLGQVPARCSPLACSPVTWGENLSACVAHNAAQEVKLRAPAGLELRVISKRTRLPPAAGRGSIGSDGRPRSGHGARMAGGQNAGSHSASGAGPFPAGAWTCERARDSRDLPECPAAANMPAT